MNDLVDSLICLGRSPEAKLPSILLVDKRRLDSMVARSWEQICDDLSEEELSSFIKGLIKYSIITGTSTGGSASPVILLYWRYVNRFPKSEPELTNWIVENRTNEYDPFGTLSHYNARSMAEYIERREARRIEVERSEQYDQQKKKERLAKRATKNIANAVRRGDLNAVISLIEKGADTSIHAQGGISLLDIARKNNRIEVEMYLIDKGVP